MILEVVKVGLVGELVHTEVGLEVADRNYALDDELG